LYGRIRPIKKYVFLLKMSFIISINGIKYMPTTEFIQRNQKRLRKSLRKESRMRLKRAGIITKIVIFALIVYASVTLVNLRAQIDAARTQQLAYQEKVTQLETSNAEYQYKIDHKDDKDTIADVARNDLGYVEPGEKVFTGK